MVPILPVSSKKIRSTTDHRWLELTSPAAPCSRYRDILFVGRSRPSSKEGKKGLLEHFSPNSVAQMSKRPLQTAATGQEGFSVLRSFPVFSADLFIELTSSARR